MDRNIVCIFVLLTCLSQGLANVNNTENGFDQITDNNTSVTISPEFPDELILYAANGSLSSTPNGVSTQENYTEIPGQSLRKVSQNAGKIESLAKLNYFSDTSVTWYIGIPIDTIFFLYLGNPVTSFLNISGPLPLGIVFDVNNGYVSGIPTDTINTTVDIRVKNSLGDTLYSVIIHIENPPAPPGVAVIGSGKLNFLLNTPVDSLKLFAISGILIKLSVSVFPSLPVGLKINSSGTLSGTPIILTIAQDYIFTFSNIGGSTSDTINLAVSAGDTLTPQIDSITAITPNGTYGLGAIITMTLHFSHAMTLSFGSLIIEFETGTVDHKVAIPAIINQTSANFIYTVKLGDFTTNLKIKSITLENGSTTFVDNFNRPVDLKLDPFQNLKAKAVINLAAFPVNLIIDTIQAGGNDTVVIGTQGVVLITPPIPALPQTQIYTRDLYESKLNRPNAGGVNVGPTIDFKDENGNAITFAVPVTVRFQIDTNIVSPADLNKVFLYQAPSFDGAPWIRLESAVREGSELVLTSNTLSVYIVALDVISPTVTPDTVPIAAFNTPLTVTFSVSDNVANPHVTVKAHAPHIALDFTVDGSAGLATIPAAYVTHLGLWYEIEASDGANIQRSEKIDVTLLVPAPMPSTVQVTEGSYEMVSIPLQPVNPSVVNLFMDDYGALNYTRWRMFDYDGKNFKKMDSAYTVKVGRAYWLRVQGAPLTVSTKAFELISMPVSRPYSIPIHSGWNTIANPFLLPVLGTSILTGGKPYALYSRSAGLWKPPNNNDTLEAWKGYVFYNPSAAEPFHINSDEFFIVPNFNLTVPLVKRNNPGEVSLKMYVKKGNLVDGMLFMGYNYTGSLRGRDSRDFLKPGMASIDLKTHLVLPGEPKSGPGWLTDIRNEISQGFTWDVVVSSSQRGEIEMIFEGIEDVSPDHGVWLLDKIRNEVVDLKKAGSSAHTYKNFDAEYEPFEVVVGTEDYLQNRLFNNSVFRLNQNYPNPFRQHTVIQYSVPSSQQLNLMGSRVTIKIYDVEGRMVKTLVLGKRQLPGHYATSWDATNNRGVSVLSGVYIYQLTVDKTYADKKFMILIR